MRKHFLPDHSRLSVLRKASSSRGWTLALTIFFGFIFSVYFLIIGALFAGLVSENAGITISGVFMSVWGMDMWAKFLIKSNTSLDLRPYLTLPVPHRELFRYVLSREFTSPWTYYIYLFYLPVLVVNGLVAEGFWYFIGLLLIVYLMQLVSSFALRLINSFKNRSYLMSLFMLVALCGLGAMMLFNGFDPMTIYGSDYPWIAFVLLGLLILALWQVNMKTMRKALYGIFENNISSGGKTVSTISVFSSSSNLGREMNMFITRTMRCKRIKSTFKSLLLLEVMALLYCAVPSIRSSSGLTGFWDIYAVGIFGLMLLQYVGAESSYFDGLASRPSALYGRVLAQFYVGVSVTVVCSMLTLAMCIFNESITPLSVLSQFFFICGFGFCGLLAALPYCTKRFELFESATFNFSGFSGIQYVWMLAVMLIMFFVQPILSIWFQPVTISWITLTVGVAFFATHRLWIRSICNRFEHRRYEIMEGYRAK